MAIDNFNSLSNLQLLPLSDEKQFENFVTQLFNHIDKTTSYDLFGRSGQKQNGLDIFSGEKKTVIQCKLKDVRRSDTTTRKELLSELEKDLSQFIKYNNENGDKFNRFIFASTFKSDAKIAEICLKKSTNIINVEYWCWNRLMSHTSERLIAAYGFDLLKRITTYYSKESNDSLAEFPSILKKSGKKLSIDKTKNFIDQLDEFTKLHYSELSFWPIRLLIKKYPLSADTTSYQYYSEFSLTSNNSDLTNLLFSVNIKNGNNVILTNEKIKKGVKNPEKKIYHFLRNISNNLIFQIEDSNSHEEYNTRVRGGKTCQCEHCSFFRLEFQKMAKRLNEKEPTKLHQMLRMAYTNYQIGRFLESYKILKKAEEKAEKGNQQTALFIIKFNLSKLGIFIRNNYYGKDDQSAIVKEAFSIDIEKEYEKQKNEFNEDVLTWIKNSTFYNKARDRTHDLVSKLRDHNENCSRGGSGSNGHINELINTYAEIDSFVTRNYIIYDRFTDYTDLTDIFIEGAFASHSIKGENNSHLVAFNEWMIMKIIFNGKADRLMKYAEKYHLEKIVLSNAPNSALSLFNIASKIFSSTELKMPFLNSWRDREKAGFMDRLGEMMSNVFVLLSYAEMPSLQVNEIASLIVDFCKKNSRGYLFHTKYLICFLENKVPQIKPEIINEFLKLSLNNKELHREDYYDALAHVIEKNKIAIHFSPKDFEKLLNISFEKCSLCNHNHSPRFALSYFGIISNKQQKQKIIDKVSIVLEAKFNGDLFYITAMRSIFSPDSKYFSTYLSSIKPDTGRVVQHSLFGQMRENKFHEVNELINICYKYSINLLDVRFNHLRGISDYYDWLLDIEGFDYSKFHPNWITLYQTIHYLKKFNASRKVKSSVINFLKKKRDKAIEFAYLNIIANSSEVDLND